MAPRWASQHYPASTRATPECAASPPRLRTETRYAARAVDTGGRHAAVEVAKGLVVEPLPTFAGRSLAADDGTVDDALPTVIGCRRSAGGDGQEQAEGGQESAHGGVRRNDGATVIHPPCMASAVRRAQYQTLAASRMKISTVFGPTPSNAASRRSSSLRFSLSSWMRPSLPPYSWLSCSQSLSSRSAVDSS